ncbi:MAG TPA: hypothetical protein VGG75_20315 [Trebonia sp.]|jgi:hypothetical protein
MTGAGPRAQGQRSPIRPPAEEFARYVNSSQAHREKGGRGQGDPWLSTMACAAARPVDGALPRRCPVMASRSDPPPTANVIRAAPPGTG